MAPLISNPINYNTQGVFTKVHTIQLDTMKMLSTHSFSLVKTTLWHIPSFVSTCTAEQTFQLMYLIKGFKSALEMS